MTDPLESRPQPSPPAAPYVPVACGVHDRLEHHAVRGVPVEVVWQEGAATRRADRLVSVGGVRPGSC